MAVGFESVERRLFVAPYCTVLLPAGRSRIPSFLANHYLFTGSFGDCVGVQGVPEKIAARCAVFVREGKPRYAGDWHYRFYTGQLILTDERLVIVCSVDAYQGKSDYSSRIETGLKHPGSFQFPLNNITEVKYQPRVLSGDCVRVFCKSLGDKCLDIKPRNKADVDDLLEAIDRLIGQPARLIPSLQHPLVSGKTDCPNCGHENPTRNRFCGGCGRSLGDETRNY